MSSQVKPILNVEGLLEGYKYDQHPIKSEELLTRNFATFCSPALRTSLVNDLAELVLTNLQLKRVIDRTYIEIDRKISVDRPLS